MKESVIVYALGKYWREDIDEIKAQYEIIACSDQNPEAVVQAGDYEFVSPECIRDVPCDKVIIGCLKRGFMRENVALKYNISGRKIFYYEELFGDSRRKISGGTKKHNEKLTVVIPTYNRKERLKRTLSLLYVQTDDDFKIIVMDNCSDYDIHNVLEGYPSQFCERIEIVCNKINIGMSANIANAFVQGVSEWMWLLSDDDIPSRYAVEDIYEEIESSEQMGVIHFFANDFSKYIPTGYEDFRNLHDLFGFYKRIIDQGQDMGPCNGDFIFMANKVYNMRYISKYCGDVFQYACSGVPQLIPILLMLHDSAACMRISCKKIVTYDSPAGEHWDYIKTLSGMRIITDIPLNLDKMERSMLYRLLLYDYVDALLKDVSQESFDYDIGQIEKLYNEVFQYCLDDEEKNSYYNKVEKLKRKNR